MSNLGATPFTQPQKPSPRARNITPGPDQSKNLGHGNNATAPPPLGSLLSPSGGRIGSSPASLPARSPFNAQLWANNERNNVLDPGTGGSLAAPRGTQRFTSNSPLPGSNVGPAHNSPSSYPQLDHGIMSPEILTNRMSNQNEVIDHSKSRQQRLETIVSTLAKRNGRVSEESVERVAQLNGLSVLWDPPLSEFARRDGSRTLTIAGTALMVDIEFIFSVPVKVAAVLPESEDDIGLDEEAISRVLKDTLVANSSVDLLSVSLGPFSKNMERLARMEKLSSTSFNCHAATSGIYRSLHKLYSVEKEGMANEKQSSRANHAAYVIADVICRGSGRPRMNAQNQIGVSLEYWIDSRIEKARQCRISQEGPIPTTTEQTGLGLGLEQGSELPGDGTINFPDVYSLTVECERLQHPMVGPARAAGGWISDSVMKPVDAANGIYTPEIDWLEPAPTILGPQPTDPTYDPLTAKLPDVQFVAKLNPPLPLPWSAAEMIYQSVNAPEMLATIPFRRFENLLLADPSEHETIMARTRDPVQMSFKNDVQVSLGPKSPGTEGPHRDHCTVLNVRRTQYGVLLESIPFSHPRMLINILPILRQYACLSKLLRKYFSSPLTSILSSEAEPEIALDPFDFPGPESSYISKIYLSSHNGVYSKGFPSPPTTSSSRSTTSKPDTSAIKYNSQAKPLEVTANVTLVGACPRLTISWSNIWSPKLSPSEAVSQKSHNHEFPILLPAAASSTVVVPDLYFSPASAHPDPETLMAAHQALPAGINISTHDDTVVLVLSFLPNGQIQILDHNLFRIPTCLSAGTTAGTATTTTMEPSGGMTAAAERLKRRLQTCLDVAADLGVWIEWVGANFCTPKQ